MARPKKEINTQEELTNSSEPVTLTHTALGIAKSKETGEWQLIRIKYDPVTRTVGEIEEEMASSFSDGAREKFKITVAKEVLEGMINMDKSESIVKISSALVKAQRKMENAVKGSKNPFFKSKFADLNAVREASMPVLNEEGISVLQPIVQKDGKSYVRTLLLHESGEYISSDTEIVIAKQNDPQAQGSAISYARRYGLQSFVSLGAEDDDGEHAMGRKSSPTAEQKVEATVQQATQLIEEPKEQKKVSTFRKPKEPVKTEESGEWE